MINPSYYLHRSVGQHGPIMPGNGSPDWPWSISLQHFRTQLDFLAAQDWSTPTMAQLIAAPEKWTGRTAVITFDDGYVDNLTAWDELQRRNMQATWFMVSGSIGREPNRPQDGRLAGRLLAAAELHAMQATGTEIGSHTTNHVRLTEADDKLLSDSKATLEEALGSEISSFAYPSGAWDARYVYAVHESGYRAACTTRTGWALRDGDHYLLRRLTVFNTDMADSLARKLYFGDNEISRQAVSRYALQRVESRMRQ